MDTLDVKGITVYFAPEHRDTAEHIAQAADRTLALLHENWPVRPVQSLRIYVMTSWLHFMFHSATWPWRVLNAVFLPLIYLRVRPMWPVIGGWSLRYWMRVAIGIKPPDTYPESDTSMGKELFYKVDEVETRIAHTTCHELTHAFTFYRQQPVWLTEGLAMYITDCFAGKQTVRQQTLAAIRTPPGPVSPNLRASVRDPKGFTYQYILGYWAIRYLAEHHPDVVADLIAHKWTAWKIEKRVAEALGTEAHTLWSVLRRLILQTYAEPPRTQQA